MEWKWRSAGQVDPERCKARGPRTLVNRAVSAATHHAGLGLTKRQRVGDAKPGPKALESLRPDAKLALNLLKRRKRS
jgi:hypothetical protein